MSDGILKIPVSGKVCGGREWGKVAKGSKAGLQADLKTGFSPLLMLDWLCVYSQLWTVII